LVVSVGMTTMVLCYPVDVVILIPTSTMLIIFFQLVNKLAEFLVRHGACIDVGYHKSNGCMALHFTCHTGNIPLVQILLKNHCKQSSIESNDHCTRTDDDDSIAYMIRSELDVHNGISCDWASQQLYFGGRDFVLDHCTNINSQDCDNNTLLQTIFIESKIKSQGW
jgi:hypothetical protein